MTLKDIFKKTEKRGQVSDQKVAEKKKEVKFAPLKKAGINDAWKVLRFPHVTEKATDLIKDNKYIFRVYPRANKTEVKRVIENFYGVNVLGVNIVNVPRRKRRLGRSTGWKQGYKKAIVKVVKDQKIEVLPR